MRLLIFLLALTSAFFVSATQEPDLTDLKQPEVKEGLCAGYYLNGSEYDGSTKFCSFSEGVDVNLESCNLAISQVEAYTYERLGTVTEYHLSLIHI